MRCLIIVVCVLHCSAVSQANRAPKHRDYSGIINKKHTPAKELVQLYDNAVKSGIKLGMNTTNIYQQNAHGGISTHRRAGRNSGSYDLELLADLQKMLGIERANLFAHIEGWWSKSGGINEPSVGSAFGVNADAMPKNSMVVTELWYEQAMFDDTFLLRAGKMDITGGFECNGCSVVFDSSLFANDEATQFLNGALVNNPTIPFPDYALGIAGFYNPIEWWYASAGVVDAQNDMRETGFRTALHKEDYFFYIFETGVTVNVRSPDGPLKGAYRVGVWNNPQPKGHSDSIRKYRDDIGFYLSCDQMLKKENTVPEDGQGLGIFFRYGYADGKKNDITNFLSLGFQYQGLLDGRDADVFGAGFARAFFSDSASTTYLTPDIQYIINPSGAVGVNDAMVLGMRIQVLF